MMPKGAGKNGNGGGPAGQGAQATPAPAAGGWPKKSRRNSLDFWWFLPLLEIKPRVSFQGEPAV